MVPPQVGNMEQPTSAASSPECYRLMWWGCRTLQVLRRPPRCHFRNLFLDTGESVFKYTPCSLEVSVGQMVELWPPLSLLQQGCLFAVVPRLPLGVTLDERSGLLYGRPQEPTREQVEFYVTACNPSLSPPRAGVALIRLRVCERIGS